MKKQTKQFNKNQQSHIEKVYSSVLFVFAWLQMWESGYKELVLLPDIRLFFVFCFDLFTPTINS